KPTTRWNIVRKAKNGLYYLEHADFEPGCSGAIVFAQFQQLSLPQSRAVEHKMASLLYSPVVYIITAIKGQASTDSNDVETQTLIQEVFLKSQRYSEAYTLALRHPARLKDTPNFLVNRAQFSVSRPDQMIHALLVVQEVRHAKVLVLFGALALLSLSVGCMVGWATRDANMGVGVSAGLFQFLTMLQWSYIWVVRR
ncbi:unnamed protein product, partial [Aureobasidium uvarum]